MSVLTNKLINILNSYFILYPGSCPRGGPWVLGVNNFSVGICDGAPSTVGSSYCLELNQSV